MEDEHEESENLDIGSNVGDRPSTFGPLISNGKLISLSNIVKRKLCLAQVTW